MGCRELSAETERRNVAERSLSKFTESTVEEAVLEWAEGLAYAVLQGPEIAFGVDRGDFVHGAC